MLLLLNVKNCFNEIVIIIYKRRLSKTLIPFTHIGTYDINVYFIHHLGRLKFEKYLNKLDISLKFFLILNKTHNHKFAIKKNKFNNVLHGNRKCTLCDDIGDELYL